MKKVLKLLTIFAIGIVCSLLVTRVDAYAAEMGGGDTYVFTPADGEAYLKTGCQINSIIDDIRREAKRTNSDHSCSAYVNGIYWVDNIDEFRSAVDVYQDISESGSPVLFGVGNFIGTTNATAGQYQTCDYYVYTAASKVYLNADSMYLFSDMSSQTQVGFCSTFSTKTGEYVDVNSFLTDSRIDTSHVTDLYGMFTNVSIDHLDLSRFDFSNLEWNYSLSVNARSVTLKWNNADYQCYLPGNYVGVNNHLTGVSLEETMTTDEMTNIIYQMDDYDTFTREEPVEYQLTETVIVDAGKAEIDLNKYSQFLQINDEEDKELYPSSLLKLRNGRPILSDTNSVAVYYEGPATVWDVYSVLDNADLTNDDDPEMCPVSFISITSDLDINKWLEEAAFYYSHLVRNGNVINFEAGDEYYDDLVDLLGDDHLILAYTDISDLNLTESVLKPGRELNAALRDLLDTLSWDDAVIVVNLSGEMPPCAPENNLLLDEDNEEIIAKYNALYTTKTDVSSIYYVGTSFGAHVIVLDGGTPDLSYAFAGIHANEISVKENFPERLLSGNSSNNTGGNEGNEEAYRRSPAANSVRLMHMQSTPSTTTSLEGDWSYAFYGTVADNVLAEGMTTNTDHMFENAVCSDVDMSDLYFLCSGGDTGNSNNGGGGTCVSYRTMTQPSVFRTSGSVLQMSSDASSTPFTPINVSYVDMFKNASIDYMGMPRYTGEIGNRDSSGTKSYRGELFSIRGMSRMSGSETEGLILSLPGFYIQDDTWLNSWDEEYAFNTYTVQEDTYMWLRSMRTVAFSSYTLDPENWEALTFNATIPDFILSVASTENLVMDPVSISISTANSSHVSNITNYYNAMYVKQALNDVGITDAYILCEGTYYHLNEITNNSRHCGQYARSASSSSTYLITYYLPAPLTIEQTIEVDESWNVNDKDLTFDLTGLVDPSIPYVESDMITEFNAVFAGDMEITTEEVATSSVIWRLHHTKSAFLVYTAALINNAEIEENMTIEDAELYLYIDGMELYQSPNSFFIAYNQARNRRVRKSGPSVSNGPMLFNVVTGEFVSDEEMQSRMTAIDQMVFDGPVDRIAALQHENEYFALDMPKQIVVPVHDMTTFHAGDNILQMLDDRYVYYLQPEFDIETDLLTPDKGVERISEENESLATLAYYLNRMFEEADNIGPAWTYISMFPALQEYTDLDIPEYRISKTENVETLDHAAETYAGNLATTDVVTIPGAESLYVYLCYGIDRGDYLEVLAGEYTGPAEEAYESDQCLDDYTGGNSREETVGNTIVSYSSRDYTNITVFPVEGDTVTFCFTSREEVSNPAYGYYAIVVDASDEIWDSPFDEFFGDYASISLTQDVTLTTDVYRFVLRTREEIEGPRLLGAVDPSSLTPVSTGVRLTYADPSKAAMMLSGHSDDTYVGPPVMAPTNEYILFPVPAGHKTYTLEAGHTWDELCAFSTGILGRPEHEMSLVTLDEIYQIKDVSFAISGNVLTLNMNVKFPGEAPSIVTPPVVISTGDEPSIPVTRYEDIQQEEEEETSAADQGITEEEMDWDNEFLIDPDTVEKIAPPAKEDVEVLIPEYTYEDLLAMIDRGEAYVDADGNIRDMQGRILGAYRGRERSPQTTDNVKTNDDTNILVYIGLLCCSIFGIVILIKKKKDEQQ